MGNWNYSTNDIEGIFTLSSDYVYLKSKNPLKETHLGINKNTAENIFENFKVFDERLDEM